MIAMTRPTELSAKRLTLRPFQAGDVEDALAYRNDPEFARFLVHIPQPFTRSDADAFVALNMSEPWDRSPTFAIVLNETVIGTVNLEVKTQQRSATLGYAIGRMWWNKGFATEAARAALGWGIEAFRLVRVQAATDRRNARSQRVLEKLGMQRQGLSVRDFVDRDGASVVEVVYTLEIPCDSGRPGA